MSKENKKNTEKFDEIVFENRNKKYGAYYLRTAYNKMVTRALTVAIIMLLLGVGIPFILFTQANYANEEKTVAVDLMDMAKPPDDAPPPPPPPPPIEQIEQKQRFVAPVIVTDSVDVDEGLLNQDDLSQVVNVEVTDEEIVVGDNTEQVIEVEKAPVFIVVEEMPSYPGGEEARMKYLQDNIKYPQMAKENDISGTVFVTFVVEADGGITDVKILKGIGGGCDEEAIRVVKLMPKWNAGKQTGKPVRVQFNMPIKFTLNS